MTGLRKWGLGWVVAFVGFPIGGALATLLVGRVESIPEALVGGLIAGAVVGAAQMLALRQRIAMGGGWIAATAAGIGLGVAIGVALFGAATTLEAIVLRTLPAGLVLGLTQSFALNGKVHRAWLWAPLVTFAYTLAWIITTLVIGANVDQGFVVFGASGAIVYQILLGLGLGALLRAAPQPEAS